MIKFISVDVITAVSEEYSHILDTSKLSYLYAAQLVLVLIRHWLAELPHAAASSSALRLTSLGIYLQVHSEVTPNSITRLQLVDRSVSR